MSKVIIDFGKCFFDVNIIFANVPAIDVKISEVDIIIDIYYI